MGLAIFGDSSHADMGVLTVASQTNHGFSLEGYFQADGTEGFLNHRADEDFVVSCLEGIGKLPVDFQLLADMGHVATAVNLSLEAANFLMAHFHLEAVFIQLQQAVFHSRAHSAVGAFPILFLHDLGSGHFFNGCFFQRSLYPEFQFRSGGKLDIDHIVAVNAFEAGNFRILLEGSQQFFLHIVQGVSQYSTGVNTLAFMHQEGRNAQGAYGFARFFIVEFHVVVYEPVHGRIDGHIHFCVVQGGNPRQHNGRTVCLYSGTSVEIVHILQEDTNRNLFVRIVTGHIHAYERYELDFRMSFQLLDDILFLRVCRNNIQ